MNKFLKLCKQLCCIIVFASVVPSIFGDLFPTPQFSGEDVTGKVFGPNPTTSDIFPIAYGDFNADKLTDIIAMTNDRASILLFIAHEEAPFLRAGNKCHIQTSDLEQKVEIIGAAPGDFTGDGVMDLLVTLKHEGKQSMEVVIFLGNSSDLVCKNVMGDTIEVASEPLVLDLNGDMIMDLVAEQFDDHDFQNINRSRKIWLFSGDGLKPKVLPFECDGCSKRYMADPTSNAFVDVDGDSVPELVIVTHEQGRKTEQQKPYYLEIFKIDVKGPIIKFKYAEAPVEILLNGKPVNVIGQPLFVDLNRNGQLMHLLPYCTKEFCRSDGIGAGSQGILVISKNATTNSTSIVELPLGDGEFEGKQWGYPKVQASTELYTKKEDYYAHSIVLRVGDYNLDGFPDLIGVLGAKGGSNELERRAVIFENIPCKELLGTKINCPFHRTFSPNYKVLSQFNNVTLGTFFDIHEDGLIDVLIVRKSTNGSNPRPGRFEVRAFQNSPDYDSNFMKVMVLSGRRCPKCPKFEIPYGNVIPGPVISYKTKTQAGDIQTAIAAQNYRSANMPMDLPYTIFGIGHSPNFVETLKISVSSSADNPRQHEWPQIIPNSQIIVIPSPLEDPKHWKAKLFLTPSDAVLQTFAVLVAICAVVGCIVIGLQIKEVREDRRDRLHEAHRFMM